MMGHILDQSSILNSMASLYTGRWQICLGTLEESCLKSMVCLESRLVLHEQTPKRDNCDREPCVATRASMAMSTDELCCGTTSSTSPASTQCEIHWHAVVLVDIPRSINPRLGMRAKLLTSAAVEVRLL
jgi:hypothetical protein